MLIRWIGMAALAAAGLYAQGLTFEVASIKPAGPVDPRDLMMGRQHVGMKVDAAQVNIANLTLADMIRVAYNLKPYQIAGPEWMKGQRWDVLAKLPAGAPPDQAPEMLQVLLRDRFKLTAHRESKEHAVYALMVGKNGPKMKPSENDAEPKVRRVQAAAPPEGAAGHEQMSMTVGADAKSMFLSSGNLGTVRMTGGGPAGMRLEANQASMGALADMLSRIVDRPVVDMTGLEGTYQFAITLSNEDLHSMAANAGFMIPHPGAGGHMGGRMGADGATGDAGGSSILQNIRELGLKLEGRKAPMEMLVVDHVERAPTEN